MNGKFCLGLSLLTLVGVCLEAAEPGVVQLRGRHPVVRGQSPVPDPGPVGPVTVLPNAAVSIEGQGPVIGTAPGYGEFSKHKHKDFKAFPGIHDNNFGYEGGYYAGPNGYYAAHNKRAYSYAGGGDGGCPHCQYGAACPQGGCRHCGLPKHYTTYEFKAPGNLSYPQVGAPAGMVQYPYYTFRGPTDFFMK